MNRLKFPPFLSASLQVVLILSGCIQPMPASTATPNRAHFETADCMMADARGMECGYLSVPEDRSNSSGPQLKLAVAIIQASTDNPAPDPVVYLYDGPGGLIMDSSSALAIIFSGILATRDLIVFDQRGGDYSSPDLECPEVESQVLQDAAENLSPAEEQGHSLLAYQACHERLVQEGIDLSAYNSAASAADLNDLRIAMGYEKWNLYGYGYGARLALTVMRDFPEGVRSVVLDSVYPPQANLDTEAAANAGRALDLLFEQCAADARCNAAYPDLKTVFYEAAAQMDANPVSFDHVNQMTHQTNSVMINGDRMINLILQLLSFEYLMSNIPKWIYEFHGGNTASDPMLTGIISNIPFPNEITSEGMRLSVLCSEETSFSSAQAIEAANALVEPRLAEAVNQGWTLAMCPAWNVKPAAAIENQPVVSDIPTLLLSGQNDPGTSPAWAKSTAQNLSHSYSFEFPWASHWLLYRGSPAAGCAQRMLNAFIAVPIATPDSTCIDGLKVNFEPQ